MISFPQSKLVFYVYIVRFQRGNKSLVFSPAGIFLSFFFAPSYMYIYFSLHKVSLCARERESYLINGKHPTTKRNNLRCIEETVEYLSTYTLPTLNISTKIHSFRLTLQIFFFSFFCCKSQKKKEKPKIRRERERRKKTRKEKSETVTISIAMGICVMLI